MHFEEMAKRQFEEKLEEESDLPVIISIVSGASPRSGHRRVNHRNANSKQQGKLDSNLFDCYLGNLWRSFSEDKRSNFTYLDCMWFSMYMEEPFKVEVLKWIKKKHIFLKKYVFVPIVHWSHWSLLIFCNLGRSLQFDPIMPCMLLLDSLRMADPKRLEPLIRKFVMDIYEAEERPEKKELVSQIPVLVPEVPQQRNDKDCGFFVLHFISLFFAAAPENFSVTEGYPYFMKDDWFGPEDFYCFCEKLNRWAVNL